MIGGTLLFYQHITTANFSAQNDTDELATFRSQWREELGLASSAVVGDTSSVEMDSQRDGSMNSLEQTSPQKEPVQSSSLVDAEDKIVEVMEMYRLYCTISL